MRSRCDSKLALNRWRDQFVSKLFCRAPRSAPMTQTHINHDVVPDSVPGYFTREMRSGTDLSDSATILPRERDGTSPTAQRKEETHRNVTVRAGIFWHLALHVRLTG